jgi:hypothetical protein
MITHSKTEGTGGKNSHAPKSWPRPETAACKSSASSVILPPTSPRQSVFIIAIGHNKCCFNSHGSHYVYFMTNLKLLLLTESHKKSSMVLNCLSRIIYTCYCVLSAFRDRSYSTLKVLGIHFNRHLHSKKWWEEVVQNTVLTLEVRVGVM